METFLDCRDRFTIEVRACSSAGKHDLNRPARIESNGEDLISGPLRSASTSFSVSGQKADRVGCAGGSWVVEAGDGSALAVGEEVH